MDVQYFSLSRVIFVEHFHKAACLKKIMSYLRSFSEDISYFRICNHINVPDAYNKSISKFNGRYMPHSAEPTANHVIRHSDSMGKRIAKHYTS